MKIKTESKISTRPIVDEDKSFLFSVFSSVRENELKQIPWTTTEMTNFLIMQFDLQHSQYMKNYINASYDIIMVSGKPAGRLYVDHRESWIRIIDIALLPEFRGRGTGSHLIRRIIEDADSKGVKVSLHVECNSQAIKLYQGLGFERKSISGIHFYMERYPNLKTTSE